MRILYVEDLDLTNRTLNNLELTNYVQKIEE